MSEMQSLIDNQPIMFHKRRTHFPSWGYRHAGAELRLPVTKDGVQLESYGLKVVIGMVAPERRWAITSSGELMDQLEFEKEHEKWYREHFWLRNQKPDDASTRPVPNIVRFVLVEPDPIDESKYREIGFDPLKPAPGGVDLRQARPDEFFAVDPKEANKWKAAPTEDPKPSVRAEITAQLSLLEKQLAAGIIDRVAYEKLTKDVVAGLPPIEGGYVEKAEAEPAPVAQESKPKRTRKPMSVEARRRLSERMKKMNAERRAKREAAAS